MSRRGVRGSETGDSAATATPDIAWRDLVSTIGADIAGPLTDALERIHAMITTGRIDKAGLRALRGAVDEARQVGMTAQQLARFASRRVRLSHERLQLTDMLQEVLQHRAREAEARSLPLLPPDRAHMKPAEVLADASLLFSLLNTTLDWALRHARSEIGFGVTIKTWPAHAVLSCSFSYRPADERDDAVAPESLDSLTWRLLEQITQTMDLIVMRQIVDHRVTLTMEFPRTANASMEGVSSVELSDDATAPNSMPLVGSHVLVVASRREMRLQIRNAIHHMGLVIDLVASVEEAVDFCRDGLPHAMIVEGILNGDRLAQLRTEIWAEAPDFAFVEIVEEGDGFEMSDAGTGHVARVARSAVDTALSSVLLFELSKGL